MKTPATHRTPGSQKLGESSDTLDFSIRDIFYDLLTSLIRLEYQIGLRVIISTHVTIITMIQKHLCGVMSFKISCMSALASSFVKHFCSTVSNDV